MKVFFFFIVLFFQLNAFSQNLAQKHLSQLPPLPSRYCSFSDAEDNTYNNQVTKVISNIERDVELLEKQLPTENQMTKNVV
ncbi:MAG TPA: hypothetical protein VHO72_17875 [Bacteroidales bacterium]|nr:hypothetical protein [Bacteroidales bacterium]